MRTRRHKIPRSSLLSLSPPEVRAGEALGDYALRSLRDAIRTGRLRPGEHLRESDLSKWLRISRTPVRQAFHSLIADGLLTSGPWNGAMVAELDQNQLVELYAVREVLEGAAAALAAKHASDAEIEHIQEIVASEREARSEPSKLVLINSELHEAIYSAAHNRYLMQSLRTVTDALGLLRHSTFVLPGSVEQANREHIQIVDAIRARSASRAEECARKHVSNALALRLKLTREAHRGLEVPADYEEIETFKR